MKKAAGIPVAFFIFQLFLSGVVVMIYLDSGLLTPFVN